MYTFYPPAVNVEYSTEELPNGVSDSGSSEDCRNKCQAREDCTHWSWTTADLEGRPNKCHLKGSAGNALHRENVVSGPKKCGSLAVANDCFNGEFRKRFANPHL